MEIILLERVEKLGGIGDVVHVKDGYARNYLLPQKKALRATDANRARFEREREALVKLNGERRDKAAVDADKLEGNDIVLIRQASDTLQLYGSVNARDIANEIAERDIPIKRHQVRLDRPIKTLGVHDVRIALHPEVVISVTVNVARSPEEAELQAKGGTILMPGEEEQAEILADAEAVFDAPSEEAQSEEAPGDAAPVDAEASDGEAPPAAEDEPQSA